MKDEGATTSGDHPASSGAGRQYVKFNFYRLDRAFLRLPEEKQRTAKRAFISTIQNFNRHMLLRSYSLVGLRADVDFMLWQVAATPEPFQALAAAISSTALGPYLQLPASYLAVTRRSIYDIGEINASGLEAAERITITPGDHEYLFVYPFVKTRAWYALPFEERQAMIDEHIRIGRKYPQIRLNTTYSYGIDDQEFVVAFEGDHLVDFVDLVMELRESQASQYTLRDTPMYTRRSLALPEVLDSLGGVPIVTDMVPTRTATDGWLDVLPASNLPPGSRTLIHYNGQQVALFNVGGMLYALNNRCTHARGPLGEGRVEQQGENCTVTCPWHEARFDLASGIVVGGVASTPVTAYQVRVRAGQIALRERMPSGEKAVVSQ